MPQLLTLSRAARLVGTTRSVLQKKIQSGELSTFEGQVAITDLLRAYPDTTMEDSSMLDRVERIKAAAVYDKRPESNVLPSPEVLAARLTNLSQELITTKLELKSYSNLLETLNQKLIDSETIEQANLRTHITALRHWLKNERESRYQKVSEPTAQLLAKDTILRIMAAHVKVIPSGHEFFLDGNDSILEAALRAGLALNYGCTGGNCGLCKARVVSGEVQQIKHHDYVISEAEKRMNYKLMCSCTAITDITIEAAEAHNIQEIPEQEIEAKVKKLERLADNLLILHLQTPRSQTLRFFAGQKATLILEEGLSADCFIASCPCDGRHLEFHLYQQPHDPFTEAVFKKLKKWHIVNIKGPKGNFVLQEDSTRPTLFIAYSHGFAPIKSLIEHAIALDTIPAFHLYWIVPKKGRHYQHNWCRAWADALDNLQYTPIISDGHDETQLEDSLSQITQDYPNLNDYEAYIAGTDNFINTAKTILSQHHLPASQCHTGS
jgi:CDP-4-dehydro-6-deoxyglucose reductase, E3